MTEEQRRGPSTVQIVVYTLLGLGAIVLVGGLVLGVAVSGGGSGGSGSAQTPFETSGPEAAVIIADFDFTPRDLTIDSGATVTWTNTDGAPHDAVSDDDDTWETDLLQEDDSGSVTFDETGEFPYHCSVHPYMEGTITVR